MLTGAFLNHIASQARRPDQWEPRLESTERHSDLAARDGGDLDLRCLTVPSELGQRKLQLEATQTHAEHQRSALDVVNASRNAQRNP